MTTMHAQLEHRTAKPNPYLITVLLCCRIHVEPGSDILFMQNIMFTACYGGQVKGWERLKPQAVPPDPPASGESPPAEPAQAPSQHCTARTVPAQQGELREQVSRQHQARIPPRQRAPTAAEAQIGPSHMQYSSEQDAATVQTAAAFHP